ncbi:MAG: PhoH family protein [Treponema sp.]|nr:PhoH family protein [Treponema sp.]
MDNSITIVLDDRDVLAGVCGPNDRNLRVIEEALGGRVSVRGNEIRLAAEGADAGSPAAGRFRPVLEALASRVREGEAPDADYTRSLVENGLEEEAEAIHIPRGFARVRPRSRNQADYIRGMRACDISFCIGPAGTGKTFLAIAEALRLAALRKVRKLVLTRPVVEAGESLGYLPGDLVQKINPYIRPLYDAMEALIPFEQIRRMEENHTIEIAPLAYMRGRSLNDSMVILDEAQNTTREQMKMFLTRIGNGSRAVITGDVTQIDLPRHVESGLLHAARILQGVSGVHFAWLHTRDVVRHPLIKKILDAYEQGEIGEGIQVPSPKSQVPNMAVEA